MARPLGKRDTKKRKLRVPKKSLDLIGKKIHRWTIIDVIQGESRSIKFKLKCDCGTEAVRKYETIAYGNSRSCGCFHREEMVKRQSKPNNHSAFNRIFNGYKFGSKAREIDFELSINDIRDIVVKNCTYCNKPPYMKMKTATGEIFYNGIDRLNNNVGYIRDNCVPCCKPCNIAKHSITVSMVKILYELYLERGFFNA